MPTTVTGTTTTVSGLTPGTLYRFRVRARNSVGYGPYSAWSEAGTPVGGPTPPPPPAVSARVAISIGQFVGGGSGGVYRLNGSVSASVTLSDSSALLGAVTYSWEGRYLRTCSNCSNPNSTESINNPVFYTNAPSEWTSVDPYAVTTFGGGLPATKFYFFNNLTGGPPTGLTAYHWVQCGSSGVTGCQGTNRNWAPHFWELRCVVSAQYILNGTPGTATGTSRTVSFKEMWGGVDYPTNIIPLIP